MEKSGTLLLKTNGGERKMHYIIDNDNIVMTTKGDSNKVKQIEADNIVSIDLNDKTYCAEIINDEAIVAQYKEKINQSHKGIQKIFAKFLGANSKTIILLKEIQE